MSANVSLYALCQPDTGDARYVGQLECCPEKRLAGKPALSRVSAPCHTVSRYVTFGYFA